MSPGLICVLLEGALRARIFSRMVFLLFTEAEVEILWRESAASLLG